MSTSKRSLDELFERVRSEQAPSDTFELQQPIHVHTTPRRSFLMLPTFITATLAVLAAVGAITVIVIHDGSDTKKKVIQTSNAPAAVTSDAALSSSEPDVQLLAVAEPYDNNKQFTIRTLSSTYVGDQSHSIQLCAIRCDDKIESSLSIEPGALDAIRSGLFNVDSLTQCRMKRNDQRVILCMFHDGTTQEVVFMEKDGPLPVMFTTANGRGHIVSTSFRSNVDANKLIPVASSENDDVVMWFPPTHDFVNSLPDDLARDLESSIVMDVRADHNKHQFFIQNNMNEANDLNIENLMSSMNFTTDTLMNCVKSFNFKVGTADSAVLDVKTQLLLQQSEIELDDSDLKVDQKDISDRDVHIKIRTSKTPKLNSQIIIISKRGASKKLAPTTQDAKLQETRTAMGALTNTTVYPNPTSDGGATLTFNLMAERTLTVTMHDLAGNLVSTLAEGVHRGAGEGQIAFVLSNVPPGMYLVTVTTDQNEKIIQRLIVQ